MIAVYVISSETGAGKTALCAALGRKLQGKGKTVGYLRVARDGAEGSRDASAIRELLGLKEAANTLFVSPPSLSEVKKAFQVASGGKDVLLVEGLSGMWGNGEEERLNQEIARSLGAKLLPVISYCVGLPWGQLADSVRKFGVPALGLVVNKVPVVRLKAVQEAVSKMTDGLSSLAIVQEDRGLMGLSVAEIAERLRAEVIGTAGGMDALVENVMVNAFAIDAGVVYFGRMGNKAVISRGERPDVHLGALNTSVRCLVLTGDTRPVDMVAQRAQEKKVPVLLVKQDSAGAIEILQSALAEARFRGKEKAQRFIEGLEKSFDFDRLYQGLGI
ncbi:MAG: protein with phosphotransacetylase BioD-like N-terminal domain [Dehalococcoidia bacterium]|nr:protein with phosphotransacetylase BioD-like N-terminal domain [Dehalococcoidia bacterium]